MKLVDKQKIGKINNSKTINNILTILMALLMFAMVFSSTMIDSVEYQTQKNIFASAAIFCFASCMFIMQKVKLFNIQSLVGTILFWPLAIGFVSMRLNSRDLLLSDFFMLPALWILLLVVTDMAVTKRYNELKQISILPFGLFVLSVLFRMYIVSHEFYSLAFLFLVVFFFVQIKEDEWERFIKCLVIGIYLSFITIGGYSLIRYPFDIGRWSGCLLNIGKFGDYLACVFVVSIFALIYFRNNGKRKSFWYIVSWCVNVTSLAFSLLCGARSTFAAELLVLIIVFVFALKNKGTSKDYFLRGLISFGTIMVLMAVFWGFCKYCASFSESEWQELYSNQISPETGRASLIGYTMYLCRHAYLAEPIAIDFNNKLLIALDSVLSQRVSIWYLAFEGMSFYGNAEPIVLNNGYYAGNAHNTFVHWMYTYGIGAGITTIVSLMVCVVNSYVQWTRQRKDCLLLSMLWATALPILMMTEVLYTCWIPMFVFWILMYPIMVKYDNN